jgi:predicted DNA-binding transcriptional regulator AlpA
MAKKPSVVVSPAVSVVPIVIDPSQILTLAELAERLKVSERWVYEKSRRRCQNPLPTIRIGRYLRFLWTDVSVWMHRHSNAAVAKSGVQS